MNLTEWTEDFFGYACASIPESTASVVMVGIRYDMPRLTVMMSGDIALDTIPDTALRLASVGVDYLLVGMDTWITPSQVDPRTGSDWRKDGIDSYHREFGDEGEVQSAIVVIGTDRTGKVEHRMTRYRRVGERFELLSGWPVEIPEAEGASSQIGEVMAAAMSAPTYREWAAETGRDVPEELELEINVARTLSVPGTVVIQASTSEISFPPPFGRN